MQQLRRLLSEKTYFLLGALILLAAFVAGTWYGSLRARPAHRETRRILYYVDPMNPAYTSPEPGLAPCGMPMEPVFAEGVEEALPPFLAPGAVRLTPEKQQLLGVRLGVVEKGSITHKVRTLARVAADASRIYRLTSSLEGWVKTVHPCTTGSLLVKDEPLATPRSREIIHLCSGGGRLGHEDEDQPRTQFDLAVSPAFHGFLLCCHVTFGSLPHLG